MKILVIAAHPLYDNRIEKHIRTCLKNGITVEYLNASESDEKLFPFINDKQVKLIHINESLRKNNVIGSLKALYQMRRYVKKSDVDIIHIHDPYLLFLADIAHKKGIKVVFDKHEQYQLINNINARVGTWLEKLNKKSIDGVVCVSEYATKYVNALRGDKAIVIPNYQSYCMYEKVRRNKAMDGSVRSTFIAATISNNSFLDGDFLFAVVNRILEECKQFVFVIGGNSDYYREQKEKLLLKFPNRFFDYGIMPYRDVIKETGKSDIGLLFQRFSPSGMQSSPNKLSEYCLSGQAIFALGDFADVKLLEDSGAVKFYPFDANPISVADDIIAVINDPMKLKNMQNNSLKIAHMLSWENVEKRYIELYSKILCKDPNIG